MLLDGLGGAGMVCCGQDTIAATGMQWLWGDSELFKHCGGPIMSLSAVATHN